jgi:hypothetical protein
MCLQRLIINNKGITTISFVAFNAADRREFFFNVLVSSMGIS